jgi:hypothetical protein
MTGISEHVVQGYLGADSEFIIADFRIYDRPAPLIEASDYYACNAYGITSVR